MIVAKIPRSPFLPHSESLLRHLISIREEAVSDVLEIGCGPASPFVGMFERNWPGVRLHQIDARRDVIPRAAAHNPRGRVEHMFAFDMRQIPSQSKQIVIAMSVFDQNAESALPKIAGEIHRVLAKDGIVVYIHNEELNPPATSASMMYQSFEPLQFQADPQYLLPNDRWHPTNDIEYASAGKEDVDRVMARLGSDGNLLRTYLDQLHPGTAANGTPRALGSQNQVSFVERCDVQVMTRLRRTVGELRHRFELRLVDHSTFELLARKIDGKLFTPDNGFRIEQSGIYEQRSSIDPSELFQGPGDFSSMVRGITKFGYLSLSDPQPVAAYRQVLNSQPIRQDGKLLVVSYQYGANARKFG